MVDVTTALPSANSGSLMGKTRGALRSMRSALGEGGEYLQGLGNRIGFALSNSLEESDLTTPSSSSPPQALVKDDEIGRKKLRLPK